MYRLLLASGDVYNVLTEDNTEDDIVTLDGSKTECNRLLVAGIRLLVTGV